MRHLSPLIFFFVITTLLFLGLSNNPSIIRSPLVGKKMPDFQLTNIAGTKQINQDIMVGDLKLLNVWASWCVACIEEHSVLTEINEKKLIKIYGVNYKDETNDALGWLKIHGNPYEINVFDMEGKLSLDLGVYGVPETFLVDKNGFIRAKYIGALSRETLYNDILPLIEKINEEK